MSKESSKKNTSTPKEKGDGQTPDVYTQVKWNGWGAYNMVMKVDPKEPHVVRHVSGKAQRHLIPFLNGIIKAPVHQPLTPSPSISVEEAIQRLPQPVINEAFVAEIQGALKPSQMKLDGEARLTHIVGKNYRDLWRIRRGMIDRAPDAIILPHCHDDCVKLMQAAHKHNVVIIPYGGGTKRRRSY